MHTNVSSEFFGKRNYMLFTKHTMEQCDGSPYYIDEINNMMFLVLLL